MSLKQVLILVVGTTTSDIYANSVELLKSSFQCEVQNYGSLADIPNRQSEVRPVIVFFACSAKAVRELHDLVQKLREVFNQTNTLICCNATARDIARVVSANQDPNIMRVTDDLDLDLDLDLIAAWIKNAGSRAA